MTKSFKIFFSQVSGKEPKLLTQDQKTILKGHNPNQEAFYQYIQTISITSPLYSLTKFIPKFQGTVDLQQMPDIINDQEVKDNRTLEWLNHLKGRYEVRNPHNRFLMMENVVHSYKRPNVIDIKLGIRQIKKEKPKKKDFKEFFILNGCRIHLKHRQQHNNLFQILFFSKYFFKTLTNDDSVLQHLALYFFDGQRLRVNLIDNMIHKIKQCILAFRSLRGWMFYSMSLCLFYDAENEELFDVKIIDFGRSIRTGKDQIQMDTVCGLENFHRFLMIVKNKSFQLQKKLIEMKKKYLQEAILIIPIVKKGSQ